MGYAIDNDLKYWRTVASDKDLKPTEHYADAIPDPWPPHTPENIREWAIRLIQAKLDDQAYKWGYNLPATIDHAINYIGDPNQQWDAEAKAMRGWRSDVWGWESAKWKKIVDKAIPCPASAEEYISDMPAAPDRPVVDETYTQPEGYSVNIQ